MSTTPIIEARPPKNRLALVSLVAALYAPVAVPLSSWLYQLALAAAGCNTGAGIHVAGILVSTACPPPALTPLSGLSYGLVVLIIPAVVVAIVSGHIALSRTRDQSGPKYRRNAALWGLILGYSTVVVVAYYLLWE